MMSCGPYGDAEEAPAVLDALEALGAVEPVVDEGAPADELGVTAAVGEGAADPDAADPDGVADVEVAAADVAAADVAAAEVAAAEVAAAEVAAAEVAAVEVDAAEVDAAGEDAAGVDAVDEARASSPLASAWWPRPDRPARRSAPKRSCRNARRSWARLSLEVPAVVDELEVVPARAPDAGAVAAGLDAAVEESAVVPVEVEPVEGPDCAATA
jgi:hypothetical protein